MKTYLYVLLSENYEFSSSNIVIYMYICASVITVSQHTIDNRICKLIKDGYIYWAMSKMLILKLSIHHNKKHFVHALLLHLAMQSSNNGYPSFLGWWSWSCGKWKLLVMKKKWCTFFYFENYNFYGKCLLGITKYFCIEIFDLKFINKWFYKLFSS